MRTSLLGMTGRDRVTEVEGVITAVAVHITGEEEVLIEPVIETTGVLPAPMWVEIPRIAIRPGSSFELSDVEDSNLKLPEDA